MPVGPRRWSAPLASALVATLLAGCAAVENVPGEAPARARVDIRNIEFEPASIAVRAGGTVSWTNRDEVAHTVTPLDPRQWGTEGSGDEEAAWLQQGESWSFTFSEPGAYRYRCIPHSYQHAQTGEWRGQLGVVTVA